MKAYTVGFQEEVVKKERERKHKEVGLLVELVMIKVGQNLVEEKMLLKVEKEDVDQLVPPVKLTKEEKDDKMNWISILKSSNFLSKHFKKVKKSLIQTVGEIPTGQMFNLKDKKFIDKFIQNMKINNVPLSIFRNRRSVYSKINNWMGIVGMRIVVGANIAERYKKTTEFTRK